jgi:hypothetical protein
MKFGRLLVLFARAALLCFCAWPVHAQDNSIAVCGTPLNDPGALSFQNYLERATAPRASVDHTAVDAMVRGPSADWPQDIKRSVFSALESFQDGDLPATAIRISRTADLPPQQIGFNNTTHELDLPFDAESSLCQDPAEATARIEAGYVILLMERAHAAVLEEGVRLTTRQIVALEEEYDRYLFEGFPMFPWEAWANSVFLTKETIAQGPPRNAIVLLHPAAGVVGNMESDARSDVGGVLSVEALGWIRYSRDYDKWYGVSLLAVFPTDRNAGYGVAFNYKNYKLGVTWHDDKDTGHDGAAIFLGIDLLQVLDEKFRDYEGYKEKLDETLRSIGRQE